ncbi:transcription factor MYB1R1 [Medicago truncatula]|uniref:transcription factor MYB1R1 n=1 Tax=Medicago truncatula TaxID=3880 RepID=UPI000D2F196F|nr:transcription factor MYB1R1 [Medicago truncatula]
MSNNLKTYDENGDRCVMLFGVNIAKNLVTDDDTMNESFSLENFNHRPDEYENENQEFDTGQSSNHEHIKKVKPWTRTEHKAFLKGLKAVGKGKWKRISKDFVVTKTPTQEENENSKATGASSV